MLLWDRPAHRCALYSVASSRDGGGGTTLTYTLEQSAIPCSVNTSGANESELFGQQNQAVTHTVGIRSEVLNVAPAPGWKIVVTDQSAQTVDGSFVTSNGLEDGEQGESLKFTGFGFTVPSGATLKGFKVELLAASDGTGTETTDLVAMLIVGGTAAGTNHASPTPWPATAGTRTYGGATDMWGLTPTVEQVNASDFGFSLRVQNEAEPAGGTSTPKIDAVRITVYYYVSLHVEGIRRGRTPPSGLGLLPAVYYFACRELLI